MRSHRPTSRVALVVVLALVLGACSRTGLPSDTAATVNGTEISEEVFERLVVSQVNDPSNPLIGASSADRVSAIGDLQRQVLSQLIRNELFLQASAELGVEVTDEDVEDRWQEEIAFRGSEEELRERLEQLGLSETEAREQLRAILAQEAISIHFEEQADVSEEDVQALYEQRLDAQYRQVAVSHILVATEEEASAILELLEGGTSFEELAEARSTDEFSAAQGGSLGTNPRGAFVPAFDDAVWNAEEGEVVGPIQTEFGFHIIRVDEFVTTPLDDVADALRSEIAQQISGAQFQDFLAQVLGGAEVTIDPRYGGYDPASGTVVAPDAEEQQPILPGDDATAPLPPMPAPTEPVPTEGATP